MAGGKAYSPSSFGIGADPGHHEHRNPSTSVPTDARGWRSSVRRSIARLVPQPGQKTSSHGVPARVLAGVPFSDRILNIAVPVLLWPMQWTARLRIQTGIAKFLHALLLGAARPDPSVIDVDIEDLMPARGVYDGVQVPSRPCDDMAFQKRFHFHLQTLAIVFFGARAHIAAVSLYVGFYNFCRVHETLRTTPAVALAVADRVWSIGDLLDAALAIAPPAPTETAPERRRRFRVIQGGVR
jgi:hypothetical protein